jgi:hypothetical protein
MFASRFLRRLFHDPARWHDQLRQYKDRTKAGRRLYVEPLEDRVLPSLLGLAPQGVAPDIASDVRTNLSYTQVGNNANPFHYDATPLEMTLGDGSMFAISNPSSGGAAKTNLDLFLDNSGKFTGAVPGDVLTVTGKVTINSNTFDGTLVTAAVRGFGFSNPTKADTEFEVRLVITGGLMTQQPVGQYRVGTELGLLIHQPGLTITSFPQTFSVSASLTGTSDLKKLRLVFPEKIPQPPLAQGQGGINACG